MGHQSLGLKITADRVKMFSDQQKSAGSVTITDLFDENNEPSGTRLEVIIKAI